MIYSCAFQNYNCSVVHIFSAGQRICRRGTERPCYRIASIPDSSLRVGFEAARQACRHDGGELASIESENEQRLVEQFLLDLGSSDTGFWIGLRWSSQPTRDASNCKSRYQWLNRSPSTFRSASTSVYYLFYTKKIEKLKYLELIVHI
uniref:C-type lectin domain-containing protein n=1 Tax=Denticeps clupeoides TaxID=299321 RepID=A0AAY4AH41_9TELE